MGRLCLFIAAEATFVRERTVEEEPAMPAAEPETEPEPVAARRDGEGA